MIDLSRNIVLARFARKLSQTQLAKRAKVSQGTIAHIEKQGKLPSLIMLGKLAKALKLKPYVFLLEYEQFKKYVVDDI